MGFLSIQNLAFTLPAVVVLILAIIGTIFGIWLVYKARRGQFACCKPVSVMLVATIHVPDNHTYWLTGIEDQATGGIQVRCPALLNVTILT